MDLRIHLFSFLVLVLSWSASVSAIPDHGPLSTRSPEGLSRSADRPLSDLRSDFAASKTSISKRSLRLNRDYFSVGYYVGLGWFCYFNLLDVVIPITRPAVEDMELFFSSVMSLAGDVWAHEPAKATRVAAAGQILLRLTSSEPIAWEWIHDFLIGAVRGSPFSSTRHLASACFVKGTWTPICRLFHSSVFLTVAHGSVDILDKSWARSRVQDNLP